MDVQLKRRHDLVPNLVTAVRGYIGHEKSVLEELTQLRSASGDVQDIGATEAVEIKLSHALVTVFGLAEAYPDLKADTNFVDLHRHLVEIEDTLQYARRYYNGTVRDYNIFVESFPSNLVASMFAFVPADFFEIELASERLAPVVRLSSAGDTHD
jgi:LemA protein